jgi:hypothetical protein
VNRRKILVCLLAYTVINAVVIILAVNAIQAGQLEDRRAESLAACKSANPQRAATYRNALRDAKTREAAAPSFEGKAQHRVAAMAERGYEDAAALVAVIAKEGVAKNPGSPQVNCEERYE